MTGSSGRRGCCPRGVDDRDDPPRRAAGRAAADGRAKPANLRHPLRVHRKLRRDPAGGVFRLPPFRPRGAGRRARTLPRGAPIEPTTWIRATAKDVALIGTLGVRETGMLASASDYHTFHKFKPGGRNQAADTYLDAVRVTVEAGIRPRLHLEDATRAPMDFMQPFIEAVQEICAPRHGLASQVPGVRHDGLGLALRRR